MRATGLDRRRKSQMGHVFKSKKITAGRMVATGLAVLITGSILSFLIAAFGVDGRKFQRDWLHIDDNHPDDEFSTTTISPKRMP